MRSTYRAPDFVADVLQTLRVDLLTSRSGAAPTITQYRGRAPIASWLRVAAVHAARRLRRNGARYVTLPTGAVDAAPDRAQAAPAEMDLLKQQESRALGGAIERTLAALDERDRALLRLYFVEGMTLAALGRTYRVHESTMMRRIRGIRERLLAEIKRDLALDSGALASRFALVESQLDVHLSRRLRAPA